MVLSLDGEGPCLFMFKLVESFKRLDPAYRNAFEVIFLYPGFKALLMHRLAHGLWTLRVPFLPRFVAEVNRFITGIEIHLGAKLGRVVIDHGLGVVIGETAVVGDDVLIYQGVSLGGTTLSPVKRHPTIEDQVVIGAGAKILGNITIGRASRIGSNSVVIESVPPESTVVGIPGRVLPKKGVKAGEELQHGDLK